MVSCPPSQMGDAASSCRHGIIADLGRGQLNSMPRRSVFLMSLRSSPLIAAATPSQAPGLQDRTDEMLWLAEKLPALRELLLTHVELDPKMLWPEVPL